MISIDFRKLKHFFFSFFMNVGPKFKWVPPALGLVIPYAIWIILFRLLSLTFITYFVSSPQSRFQDISDVFISNEVTLMGLAAFLYVWLIRSLNPLPTSAIASEEYLDRNKIEKQFTPGFLKGALLAGLLVLFFLLTDLYRYWGYYIQLDEAPLELLNIFLRMLALAALAYSEEYFFRSRLIAVLPTELTQLSIAHICSLLFCSIKMLQFDLSITQILTLYILSFSLSLRKSEGNSFAYGAGFWAALLIVFQPLLSLPIFGNDFSGILLIKHRSFDKVLEGAQSSPLVSAITSRRLLNGGAGGPLSSLTFQFILCADIAKGILQRRKKNAT